MRLLPFAVALLWSVPLRPQAPVPDPDVSPQRRSDIVTNVTVVVAPTVVQDKDGSYISDLRPTDFMLLDNNRPQRLVGDVSFQPISMVVAIQADSATEAVLPKVKKIGPLLEGLILGDRGEAALLAYDHRFKLLHDFTSDGTKLKKSLEELKPGSASARQIDAVNEAIRMLRNRPKGHRKIVLLISETRDKSSEGQVRDVLTNAEVGNVTVYSLNMNRLVTGLTTPMQPPRPHPIPPTNRMGMPGGTMTPTTAAQQFGGEGWQANFVPLLAEIFRAGKGLFVDNPSEVFTKYTGGREYSFTSDKDLDRAFLDLSNELQSQYLLAYSPDNLAEGGYHQIQVVVKRPDLKVRTRPGYWMAAQ